MLDANRVRNEARICLGVCTYERPLRLGACLNTINRLKAPAGCRLDIVVVDNELTPAAEDEVGIYSEQITSERFYGHEWHYVHEPRRGISHARNAVIEKALQLEADWIAMLDDDQIVPPDWLKAMWRALDMIEADVVEGYVAMDYPEPLPKWAFPKKKKRRWKVDCDRAATGGVLFSAELVRADGMALRFRPDFNFTGGEDRDFFVRACRAGAVIIRTPDAISCEFVPESRLSLKAQLSRSYCTARVNAWQDRELYGFTGAMVGSSVKFMDCFVKGAGLMLTAPFAIIAGQHAVRRRVLKGGQKLAQVAGISAGLARRELPQPYLATTHGS